MSTNVRTLPPIEEVPTPSLGVHDILFVFFKHKRTILICTALGLVAAAAVFFFYPPLYQSQAKLLVRYVVERSAVDAVDTNSNPGGSRSNQVIASEVEILTSLDLTSQVAEAIGPKRFLPDAKETPSKEVAAKSSTGVCAWTPRRKATSLWSHTKAATHSSPCSY